jgi:hypothetical protein
MKCAASALRSGVAKVIVGHDSGFFVTSIMRDVDGRFSRAVALTLHKITLHARERFFRDGAQSKPP